MACALRAIFLVFPLSIAITVSAFWKRGVLTGAMLASAAELEVTRRIIGMSDRRVHNPTL